MEATARKCGHHRREPRRLPDDHRTRTSKSKEDTVQHLLLVGEKCWHRYKFLKTGGPSFDYTLKIEFEIPVHVRYMFRYTLKYKHRQINKTKVQ